MRNLLINGELTEPFRPYRGDEKLLTAVGWAPWWTAAADTDPDWKHRQPIFTRTMLDGRFVQQLSTPFGTHNAGVWQQIPAAAGNEYEISADGQAWSSESAEAGSFLEASDVNLQVGVDPTGGLDPESPLVIWSTLSQPLGRWETIRLTVQAEAGILTIFLKSTPNLPKRQQSVFWRNVRLRPIGRYKRSMNIIGAGDTHITLEPERPQPGEAITAVVSSTRHFEPVSLSVRRPDNELTTVSFLDVTQDADRIVWRYQFFTDQDGLYDIRFLGDEGARLLALRLLRVARDVQLVPSDDARTVYHRVYVLLPPTADLQWLEAAARGSFDGRYTVGFSADDAGIGNLDNRQVLAVNPHHWPEVLTEAWFRQHYPGVKFTAVIASSPEDLESWLKKWLPEV